MNQRSVFGRKSGGSIENCSRFLLESCGDNGIRVGGDRVGVRIGLRGPGTGCDGAIAQDLQGQKHSRGGGFEPDTAEAIVDLPRGGEGVEGAFAATK